MSATHGTEPNLGERAERWRRAPDEESPSAEGRHRVVVVGGGFGGLLATESLRKGDVEITLVDRTNHHLFQPLLYQVATGILSVGQIAPPLRGILRKHKNIRCENNLI